MATAAEVTRVAQLYADYAARLVARGHTFAGVERRLELAMRFGSIPAEIRYLAAAYAAEMAARQPRIVPPEPVPRPELPQLTYEELIPPRGPEDDVLRVVALTKRGWKTLDVEIPRGATTRQILAAIADEAERYGGLVDIDWDLAEWV